MAYCRKCGAVIDDEAVLCPHCGVEQVPGTYRQSQNDDGSIVWAVVGFLIPIVGLILWIAWNTDRPKSARMAGIGALVSVLAGVIIALIVFIALAAFVNTEVNVQILGLL